jgi:hypothetical protein
MPENKILHPSNIVKKIIGFAPAPQPLSCLGLDHLKMVPDSVGWFSPTKTGLRGSKPKASVKNILQ